MGTQREHLEIGARAGSAPAMATLYEGPQMPDALSYLYDWARELHGKSGVGMNGYNPLTYTTIADWARLTGTVVYPHEVAGLFALDAVLCNPPDPEKKARGD